MLPNSLSWHSLRHRTLKAQRTPLEEELWQKNLHPNFETSQLFWGFICGAGFGASGMALNLMRVKDEGFRADQIVLYFLCGLPVLIAVIGYQFVRKALQKEVMEYGQMVRMRWGAYEQERER